VFSRLALTERIRLVLDKASLVSQDRNQSGGLVFDTDPTNSDADANSHGATLEHVPACVDANSFRTATVNPLFEHRTPGFQVDAPAIQKLQPGQEHPPVTQVEVGEMAASVCAHAPQSMYDQHAAVAAMNAATTLLARRSQRLQHSATADSSAVSSESEPAIGDVHSWSMDATRASTSPGTDKRRRLASARAYPQDGLGTCTSNVTDEAFQTAVPGDSMDAGGQFTPRAHKMFKSFRGDWINSTASLM